MHVETIIRTNISLHYQYEGLSDFIAFKTAIDNLKDVHRGTTFSITGIFDGYNQELKLLTLQELTNAGIDLSEVEFYHSPYTKQLRVVWFG
ncbi:hypothetical protein SARAHDANIELLE_45 [Hafnia phage vB_HpaM_SarahDanielle]|uniref:Uncharacterized protein n=1 Tax=Hafnia phage vB_HpaM_SarahDanielle TaxID=2836113 RepID=A0AAE7WA48_9CAUD|nr:hypothetical protein SARAHDANIELLE_45 [Hafnia phage vB_HpaM_SarahDanielle]